MSSIETGQTSEVSDYDDDVFVETVRPTRRTQSTRHLIRRGSQEDGNGGPTQREIRSLSRENSLENKSKVSILVSLPSPELTSTRHGFSFRRTCSASSHVNLRVIRAAKSGKRLPSLLRSSCMSNSCLWGRFHSTVTYSLLTFDDYDDMSVALYLS